MIVEVQIKNLQRRPAGWILREQLKSKSKGVCWQNSFLLVGSQSVFALFKPSID